MGQVSREALGAAYSECVTTARLLVPQIHKRWIKVFCQFWIICISTSLISSGSGVSIMLIL